MPMLFVPILMDHTIVHVKLDFQGMGEFAQVIFLKVVRKVSACSVADSSTLDGTMKHFCTTELLQNQNSKHANAENACLSSVLKSCFCLCLSVW